MQEAGGRPPPTTLQNLPLPLHTDKRRLQRKIMKLFHILAAVALALASSAHADSWTGPDKTLPPLRWWCGSWGRRDTCHR